VSWELFEYFIKYTSAGNYYIDTAVDIFLGVFGGLLVHQLTKAYTMK
jgi:hypothetical protein